jgi:hypothetical protein
MKLNKLGDIPVIPSLHGALNYSRGVISDREIDNVTDEELLER